MSEEEPMALFWFYAPASVLDREQHPALDLDHIPGSKGIPASMQVLGGSGEVKKVLLEPCQTYDYDCYLDVLSDDR